MRMGDIAGASFWHHTSNHMLFHITLKKFIV
jgi:hypothetical protein